MDRLPEASEVRKQTYQEVIVRTSDHLRGLASADVPWSMFVPSIMETIPLTIPLIRPDCEDVVEGLGANDFE